jgi:large conductance mechanosensitive channel
VVRPLNKLAERRARGVEPKTETPSEEVVLLTEIRDSLRVRD